MTTVNRLGVHLGNVEKKLEAVVESNETLVREVEQLKIIVDKMLMTHHPEYKRSQVLLRETGDFLRSTRRGRARSTVND
jgi:hypothetical protein